MGLVNNYNFVGKSFRYFNVVNIYINENKYFWLTLYAVWGSCRGLNKSKSA
jgi:hypothetical protein